MSGTMDAACGEEDSGTEPNPAKGGPFAPFNVSVSCCVNGLLNSVPVFDSVAAPAFWGLARFAVVDRAALFSVDTVSEPRSDRSGESAAGLASWPLEPIGLPAD